MSHYIDYLLLDTELKDAKNRSKLLLVYTIL
jgi:hypothetical protein